MVDAAPIHDPTVDDRTAADVDPVGLGPATDLHPTPEPAADGKRSRTVPGLIPGMREQLDVEAATEERQLVLADVAAHQRDVLVDDRPRTARDRPARRGPRGQQLGDDVVGTGVTPAERDVRTA